MDDNKRKQKHQKPRKATEALSDQQLVRKLGELESLHGKVLPARQEANGTAPKKPNPEMIGAGNQNQVKVVKIAVTAGMDNEMCAATGIRPPGLAYVLLGQVIALQFHTLNQVEDDIELLKRATATIGAMEPANMTEAMLSVQMIGVHNAAVNFMVDATSPNQTFEGKDANVFRTTRLMRLFNEQLEAMAKLKGKTTQQRVVVEHVHVNAGGQAIVGAVTAGKQSKGEGTGEGN
jgi:hypothetical protein